MRWIVHNASTMEISKFQDAIAELLREAFEGIRAGADGTWFVQGSEAILPTLQQLSAEQASKVVIAERASIGAHTRHLVYIMAGANMCHGVEAPAGGWEDTWRQNEFSAEEWQAMIEELESRYQSFTEWFRTNPEWRDDHDIVGPIAILPHVVYHLGAIRQLVALV